MKKSGARSGVTILELLIAMIIIGVLVSIAVPAYLRNMEQSKGAKALEHLNLIRSAEGLYRVHFSGYTGNLEDLRRWGMDFITADRDWTYDFIGEPTEDSFTIEATRSSGMYSGARVRMEQQRDSFEIKYYAPSNAEIDYYPPP